MNNKLKYFLFLFFIFFLFILPVKADDCSTLDTKIENYNLYVTELEGLDCSNVHDEQSVIKCNDLNLKKNLTVVDLMKQKEQNKVCESKLDIVDKIVEENEDNCGKVYGDNFTNFVNTIMTIFYILGPILLIVFGSLDYAKASVSGDEKSLKKAHKTFFKRLLATILLLLTPMITNLILSFNMSEFNLSGNSYSCNYEYLVYNKEWNITAVRKNTSNYKGNLTVNSQGVQAMLDAAKKLNQKFIKEKWTYGSCSGSNIKYSIDCPSKKLVCADLIAQVLYLGNIFSEEEINSTKYNGCCGIYNFLLDHGWQRIENYDDLRAGDVCFFKGPIYSSSHGGAGEKYYSKHVDSNGKHVEYGHTALYAGDNRWYDTGSDSSIVRESPYYDASYHKSTFAVGLRMP